MLVTMTWNVIVSMTCSKFLIMTDAPLKPIIQFSKFHHMSDGQTSEILIWTNVWICISPLGYYFITLSVAEK